MYLPASFGRKGPHLRRWLVTQPLHQMVFWLRFSGVFLSPKANVRRFVHRLRDHLIIILSLVDRRDWHDTQGKWSLARNLDKSSWYCQNSLKLFWLQHMAPWTTGYLLDCKMAISPEVRCHQAKWPSCNLGNSCCIKWVIITMKTFYNSIQGLIPSSY